MRNVLEALASITDESESYDTTDGQSVSLSWNKAPIWGLRPDIYYFLTISVLLSWSALSDEMTGLSFAHATSTSSREAHLLVNYTDAVNI
jgi:hypothetical protein